MSDKKKKDGFYYINVVGVGLSLGWVCRGVGLSQEWVCHWAGFVLGRVCRGVLWGGLVGVPVCLQSSLYRCFMDSLSLFLYSKTSYKIRFYTFFQYFLTTKSQYICTRNTLGTYIRWQLKTCCACMKDNRSFRRKHPICDCS